MRWINWDPKTTGVQRDDGRKLHDAYPAFKDMDVYAWHEANAKTPTFKRWFAESDAENVKNVLGSIVDMSLPVPEVSSSMTKRALYRDDFGNNCDPGTYAYSTAGTNKHRFCDRGMRLPQLDSLTCSSLDKTKNAPTYYSSAKIRSFSGTILHESTYVFSQSCCKIEFASDMSANSSYFIDIGTGLVKPSWGSPLRM
jgi:hypothetical protein